MILTIKTGLKKISLISMALLIVLIMSEGLNLLADKVLADSIGTVQVEVTNSTPDISFPAAVPGIYYGASSLTIPEWASTLGTLRVSTTFRVTDNNGWAEISTTTIYVYRSGVGLASCDTEAENNINNCYPSTSTKDSAWHPDPSTTMFGSPGAVCNRWATGTTYADFWCTTTFYYVAEATDADNSARGYSGNFSAENWVVYASTSDINWAQDEDGTETIELATNAALVLGPASITYPNLGAGVNSGSSWQTTTVTTSGNVGIDVQFSGANMTGPGDNIDVTQQLFTTTSAPKSYGDATANNTLTGSAVTHDMFLSKPTTTLPLFTAADDVYWGIAIPAPQAIGIYTSTGNTLTATTPLVYP